MSALEDAILDAVENGPDPDAEGKRGGLDDNDSDDESGAREAASNPFSAPTDGDRGAFERMPGVMDKATGPKGVLADYKRYQQFVKEQDKAEAAKRIAMANRLVMSGRTLDSSGEDKTELDEEDLLEDEAFLREYSQKRLEELKSGFQRMPKFGLLKDILAAQYVDAIDKEDSSVHVVIHLYDPFHPACLLMNQVLAVLAKQHAYVKFLKVVAKTLSAKFSEDSLPTVLVYKGGELVGNFIRITDTLGEDFTAPEVEYFLAQKKFLVPELAAPLEDTTSKRYGIKSSSISRSAVDDDDDDD